MQVARGLLLVIFYTNRVEKRFERVERAAREALFGWELRRAHMLLANLLFLFMFLHMFRGAFIRSWKRPSVWGVGWAVLVRFIAVAFLGYVLPWGQMSVWGAAVITNFLRVVPALGEPLVSWVWAGYSVRGPTLKSFFMLHFIVPLGRGLLVFCHLFVLHVFGSRSARGMADYSLKTRFFPKFILKDRLVIGLIIWGFVIGLVVFWLEEENFLLADLVSSPLHIKPEWYFLFFYGELRRVPSKLIGVVLIGLSVLGLGVSILSWSNLLKRNLKKICL